MRPDTLDALASAVYLMRRQFKQSAATMSGGEIVACAGLAEEWKPGAFAVGDIRKHGGQIYRCCQAHDNASNPDIEPGKSPAQWAAYHATDAMRARPWVQPTGAHDQYKAGEYMVWTDGKTYRCKQDTAFSPDAYPAAWEAV